MNEIEFNSDKMNEVSTLLNEALALFDVSIASVSGLDIPDFSYSSWLRNCPSMLKGSKSVCSEDLKWAAKCISNYDNFNSQSIDTIN